MTLLAEVRWLLTESGRAGLRGVGVARVTVWRWGPEVGTDLAAALESFGVGCALFARVGIWGCCWRDVEGPMGPDRSYGILAEAEEEAAGGSLLEEEREVLRFLILLVASCLSDRKVGSPEGRPRDREGGR